MAFEIRVPTGKGDAGAKGGGAKGGADETNKLLKKLDKTMIMNIDLWEVATSLLKGLIDLFRPLIKVLSLLLLIVFLPLLPLILKLVDAVVMVIEGLLKLFGGEISLVDFLKDFLGPALLEIVKALGLMIFEIVKAIGALLWATFIVFVDLIIEIGKFIGQKLLEFGDFLVSSFLNFIIKLGEGIQSLGQWFKEAAIWLWERIKTGFENIINFGADIWQFFLDGLGFIANLGEMIWNVIKDALGGLADAAGGGIDFVKSLVGLADGGIVTGPTPALIGEAGPEAVIPLSKLGGMGTNITINNPVIRDNSDIRKMTDAISRELQKRGNRGFSA